MEYVPLAHSAGDVERALDGSQRQVGRRTDRLLEGGLRYGDRHEVRHGGVDREHDREGEAAGMRAQKCQHMPLRLRHQVQEPPRGGVPR